MGSVYWVLDWLALDQEQVFSLSPSHHQSAVSPPHWTSSLRSNSTFPQFHDMTVFSRAPCSAILRASCGLASLKCCNLISAAFWCWKGCNFACFISVVPVPPPEVCWPKLGRFCAKPPFPKLANSTALAASLASLDSAFPFPFLRLLEVEEYMTPATPLAIAFQSFAWLSFVRVAYSTWRIGHELECLGVAPAQMAVITLGAEYWATALHSGRMSQLQAPV